MKKSKNMHNQPYRFTSKLPVYESLLQGVPPRLAHYTFWQKVWDHITTLHWPMRKIRRAAHWVATAGLPVEGHQVYCSLLDSPDGSGYEVRITANVFLAPGYIRACEAHVKKHSVVAAAVAAVRAEEERLEKIRNA